jgi:hypothetical protein
MYFAEAVNDKYKRITDSFHVDSLQNHDICFEEEENYICTKSDTSYKEFCVGIEDEFPHFSRKDVNILLLSQHPTCARPDLQQRQPSKQSIVL